MGKGDEGDSVEAVEGRELKMRAQLNETARNLGIPCLQGNLQAAAQDRDPSMTNGSDNTRKINNLSIIIIFVKKIVPFLGLPFEKLRW